jgi:hypothetical protein
MAPEGGRCYNREKHIYMCFYMGIDGEFLKNLLKNHCAENT